MRWVVFSGFLLFLSACADSHGRVMWRVRDMVLAPTPEIDLQGRNQQVVATVAKLSMQKLLLAHFRVTRAAGVPGAATIAGLGADLIDASYSRDQEREADALGVGYVMSAGFDPNGGIRLHEKLLKTSRGLSLPFLSSHPSGEERIENLKALIGDKQRSYGGTSVSDPNNQ